jgi:large conductance mechanosensitive channel
MFNFQKTLKEFKAFAVKGNMIDLAVGIIIGTAFNKVIHSLVNSIFMPGLGMMIGKVDFKQLEYVLKEAEYDEAGKLISQSVVLKYGEFIQAVTDFVVIALVVFAVIKFINIWKKKAEDPKNKEIPTPKDIELLSEIRDILKELKIK